MSRSSIDSFVDNLKRSGQLRLLPCNVSTSLPFTGGSSRELTRLTSVPFLITLKHEFIICQLVLPGAVVVVVVVVVAAVPPNTEAVAEVGEVALGEALCT